MQNLCNLLLRVRKYLICFLTIHFLFNFLTVYIFRPDVPVSIPLEIFFYNKFCQLMPKLVVIILYLIYVGIKLSMNYICNKFMGITFSLKMDFYFVST